MYGITDLMSQKEKTNIRIMTTAGVRNDGRGCLDARPVNLEVAVMPDCYGSARVRIGRTDVLATVRAEFSVPNPPGRRGAGPLDISVDLRGIGGEGRSLLFRSRKDALEDYSYLTCKILERMYNTYTCRVIRDSRLEIIPGQLHWLLHVDVSPVESDGNLLDAITLAVRSALRSTWLPHIDVFKNEETGAQDVRVCDDRSRYWRLEALCAPLTVTLLRVGTKWVVDPTETEEAAADGRLIMGLRLPYPDEEVGMADDEREALKGKPNSEPPRRRSCIATTQVSSAALYH